MVDSLPMCTAALMSGDITVKCCGGYSGIVRLASSDCTVGDLRQAVSERLGGANPGSPGPKLILGGRELQDETKPLSACGLSPASKVLVLAGRSAPQVAAVQAQEDRAARIDRLKAAATTMASRADDGDRNGMTFEIENQAGTGLRLSEEDRKALGVGLAMHSRGQQSLKQGNIKDALQELLLAEEAFDLASSSLTDSIDNVGLLLLDITWCFFLLQDSSKLASAQHRLQKARSSLVRSHGADMARLRVLHGGFRPETAIYVRLELLEGVAAYLAGDRARARERLQAAQAKWQQLQVSDVSVAMLLGMGFSTTEASRALRFCGVDVNRAAEHAFEQQKLAKERTARDQEAKKLRREQRRYGKTRSGKPVNMEALGQLAATLGFDRGLVALALIQGDNNGDAALDLLTSEESRELLQQEQSRTQGKKGEKRHREACRVQLLQLGFAADAVDAALAKLGIDCEVQAAIDLLVSGELEVAAGPSTSNTGPISEPVEETKEPQVDHEIENSIAEGIQDDPLAAYDVDVSEEGKAIQAYLEKLA